MINLTITENGCSCQDNPALEEGNLEWATEVATPTYSKIDSGDPERDEEYRKQKISYQKKMMKTSKAVAKGESPQDRADRLAQWWCREGNHPCDTLDFVLSVQKWAEETGAQLKGKYILTTGDGRIIAAFKEHTYDRRMGILQDPQSPKQKEIFPVEERGAEEGGETVFCLDCASRYVAQREGGLIGRLKIVDLYDALYERATHNCICGSYEDHSLYYLSPQYGYRPKCDVLRKNY